MINNFDETTFSDLINDWVNIDENIHESMIVRKRIDVLERFLEEARFYLKYPKNNLPLEEFLQSECAITNDNKFVFKPAKNINDQGCGTPPICLQPHLLLFLLLYHKSKYSIIDIISLFIEKVRDDLDILDFKKTQTGVTRCYTNTRFAANTLRDFGLLKFTNKEAYKTWVLSLPGFIVAAEVLQFKNWVLQKPPKDWSHRLHPAIYEARKDSSDYKVFVSRLASICKQNIEIFSSFEKVLKMAYLNLLKYWEILNDPILKNDKKKEISSQLINEIDGLPGMNKFYIQFSDCLNIDELLKGM
jgi:hypothetical protein